MQFVCLACQNENAMLYRTANKCAACVWESKRGRRMVRCLLTTFKCSDLHYFPKDLPQPEK